MNAKERIQFLCKKNGITSKSLEEHLGFGKGYISKIDKAAPNLSKIKPIADYFGVTVDYLLSGEKEPKEKSLEFTTRDKRDIAKDLETLREKLASKELGPAAFDGEDIPDEDAELFLGQVELMLRRLKVKNKEKYNPHKNKK